MDPVIVDNWPKSILFILFDGFECCLRSVFFLFLGGVLNIVSEVAMWKRNLLKNVRKGWFGLVGLQEFLWLFRKVKI